MSKCLNLLLLLLVFCLVYQSEILPAGNPFISVSGKKRGSVTLRCEHEDSNIVQIDLITQSEIISVCETEECRGRVFKEGNCDVVIKNLIFSDAGKYTLRIYNNNDQTELKYQLHIDDEISVKTGEELKMSVLVSDADKVKTNSSGEWKEVWTRDHGVQSDRMNDDNDGNLIIKSFLDSDAGTYRVLDTEGEILITVTVTESKKKLEQTDKEQTDDTKYDTVWICILTSALSLCLCFWFWWFWTFFKFESLLKRERLHRNVECGSKWSKFNKL
ncbi:uncharacterized protein LOC127935357 isoform X2 [Carassius gibelio]|uniref:uncharacterized protein LOC127935357 isoform X2 n=1 Tax=Carassius gibelio TaxID=101364 RepID=UPI002279DCF4|nr:uncharacterized protein LOC127935357 isoform X2 [Carassius gibelio]